LVQRILQPGEIESLDRTAIPRLRLPERLTVFSGRAERLRRLADNSHPIAGYLMLMASLVDAQHQVLTDFSVPMPMPMPVPNSEEIARAQANSMPIANSLTIERARAWHKALRCLIDRIDAPGAVTPAVGQLLGVLRTTSEAQLETAADAILSLRFAEIDPATAPFLMAALQVVWTDIATRLDIRDVPYLDTPGMCPVCGSMPVASIVRIGGAYQGYRYLQCGLCATEWHMVRIKCSNCDSTKGIAYHGVERGSEAGGDEGGEVGGEALKAESCDECRVYRKIGYQEKDYDFEPLADDLASLTLDLLMSEAGYRRASPNPLFWSQAPAVA
jgi:FdhE protein